MSNDNFESVWFILNEYDFRVDVSDRGDLTCVFCRSLLTEAVQSVKCGCRYCRRCLEMYLTDGSNKPCPGGSSECQRALLDLSQRSIRSDDETNRVICSLRVRCPFDSCGHEDELARMGAHLGLCQARLADSGCSCQSLKNKELVNHIRIDEIVHLRLLIESIDNLRNDNKLLQMEISATKRESDEKRIIIDKLQSQIDEINRKLDQIIINQKFMGEKLDDLCMEKDADTRPKNTDPECVSCNGNKSANNISSPIGELIWTIDNFMSRKSEMLIGKIRWLDSEVFVTSPNMHKMKLRLWIGEATVDMMVKMIPEDNPDCRRWPVMCDVKIGMINPDTQEFQINDSRIIEYKTFYFSSKSSFQFQLSSLKRNVLRNDVLIIKCVINELD